MAEQIGVQVRGGVPSGLRADTGARIAAAADRAGTLMEAVRIRLTAPSGSTTALAQANAEVEGRRIRVQVSAPGLAKAADRLVERMQARIAAVTGPWRPRPWPDRDAAVSELRSAPVPAGLRRIARVKRPALVWCSPEAAARTMDAMDYDVHLFTDPATEADAVVYRVGPTGYRLSRLVACRMPKRSSVPMTLSAHPAPRLTESQAVDRLRSIEQPSLFFARPEDTGSGRGCVLYRRLDGHYGLILSSP